MASPSLSSLVLLAFTKTWHASDTHAHLAVKVAELDDVGQVCLDEEEQELLAQRLRAQVDTAKPVAITIFGYSDEHEPRRSGLRAFPCLSHEIPEFIKGHEVVAAARALHVYEIAHRAEIPGFLGAPVFSIPLEDGIVSTNDDVVTITPRRGVGKGPFARRVEVVTHEPRVVDEPATASNVVMHVLLPEELGPDHEAGPVPRGVIEDRVPPSSNRSAALRALGWTELAIGVAAVGVGAGFLATGVLKQQLAGQMLDPMASGRIDDDAARFIRGGGLALALGSGLVVGGAITLILDRRQERRKESSRKTSSVGKRRLDRGVWLRGASLRW